MNSSYNLPKARSDFIHDWDERVCFGLTTVKSSQEIGSTDLNNLCQEGMSVPGKKIQEILNTSLSVLADRSVVERPDG